MGEAYFAAPVVPDSLNSYFSVTGDRLLARVRYEALNPAPMDGLVFLTGRRPRGGPWCLGLSRVCVMGESCVRTEDGLNEQHLRRRHTELA
jgi:hypothetical protein